MTNKVRSSWLGDYYSLAFARLRNDWCFVQAALPETLGDCHALHSQGSQWRVVVVVGKNTYPTRIVILSFWRWVEDTPYGGCVVFRLKPLQNPTLYYSSFWPWTKWKGKIFIKQRMRFFTFLRKVQNDKFCKGFSLKKPLPISHSK